MKLSPMAIVAKTYSSAMANLVAEHQREHERAKRLQAELDTANRRLRELDDAIDFVESTRQGIPEDAHEEFMNWCIDAGDRSRARKGM